MLVLSLSGFFNVAKIASARASSTISLTISLRVAGPLGHGYLYCRCFIDCYCACLIT